MITSSTTTGTATTAASNCLVSVYLNGAIVTVNSARGLAVAVGDVVLMHRVEDAYYVCCVLYPTAPEETAPNILPPDLLPPVYDGRTVVMPVYTGTYRNGAWLTSTTDTLQGVSGGYANATGTAFYGAKPASLTGTVVTAATVRLIRRAAAGAPGAQATTLRLVTESEQPAGAPTLTSTTAGPSLMEGETVEAYPVPTAWAQAMADGTAGGLALFDGDGSPYVRYAGRGTDPTAWTLTIDWTRTP